VVCFAYSPATQRSLAHLRHTASYSGGSALIAPESIASILYLKSPIHGVSDLEAAISAGLPRRSLGRLSARLYLDRRAASASFSRLCHGRHESGASTGSPWMQANAPEYLARALAQAESFWPTACKRPVE